VDETAPSGPLLRVTDLCTVFETDGEVVRAADGVSFDVGSSEIVALVGESGCGKSVTALSILRLIDPPGRIASGAVLFHDRDLLRLPEREMRAVRGREIAMVFQEPMTALNPLMTVGRQVMEVFRVHQDIDRSAARRLTVELFQLVGIPAPDERIDQYPHQLSGGMRQRVMIAMALACRPALIIADEPTTALDVTIQAQILDLLDKLRRDLRVSILLITHDLAVVAETAQRVVVMYAGQVVETADVRPLFGEPLHPYTRALLASLPPPGAPADRPLHAIPGVVPDLRQLPPGCRFAERCSSVFDRCREEAVPLYERPGGRTVRCLLYAEAAR
jgi:peptide/nickel transport system ATP-binding protein